MRTKNMWLVAICLASLGVTLLFAQTSKKKTTSSKAKSTQTAKAKARAKADSLARVDSLRRVAQLQAINDSIKRAEAAKSDSSRVFDWRKIDNKAFGVGERLIFNVSYGPITAGEAFMSVPRYEMIGGRNCYRIEFIVNSLSSFDWIFEVRDRYLTFIDTQAIAPLRFEQHIREGTYKLDFTADFDQVNHVAKTSTGNYPIPEYVHDIMSAFYYARMLDYSRMKPGEHVTLFNFYKDKSHELRVKFLGNQELEVEAGTFNTIVVEPLVKEGGLFKAEGRIVIWLTDDDRKIPIRVNTKVVIGSIDVELREYVGLVGPLRSRLK